MVSLKRLKININAGIIDIVGTFLYFFSIFLVGVFNGAVGAGDSTEFLMTFLLIFAIISIVIHAVAFFQSKKVHIRLIGNSLGIIGHGIYLICGTYLGWLAMIFTVLAAVFVLKDNHYSILDTIVKEN